MKKIEFEAINESITNILNDRDINYLNMFKVIERFIIKGLKIEVYRG